MVHGHEASPGAGSALAFPHRRLRTTLAFALLLAFAMPTLLDSAGAPSATAAPAALLGSPDRVALGVYRPEYPDNLASLQEYDRLAGYPLPIVSWYALWGGWKSAFNRADLDRVAARGSVPLITWEPWAGKASDPAWSLRRAILSGKNDAYITSWARGLAAYGKPVLLRFAHEMHHQTYPWAVGVNGNTAKDYIATWRRVHDIFRRNGATNVQWVWNPNTMKGATRSYYSGVYRSVYPGDSYVDWLGLDIYNGAWTGSWRSLAEALAEPYAAITALSTRPLLLGEVGCQEEGGSKAEWISQGLETDLGAFPRVRALVWFDVVKEAPWALHSSPEALAAWAEASAQPRFAAAAPAGGGAVARNGSGRRAGG